MRGDHQGDEQVEDDVASLECKKWLFGAVMSARLPW